MEVLRRTILFFMGFVAAASVMIADDRMALNYGLTSALDVSEEVRETILAVRERWDTPQEDMKLDPQVLEAFVTQKI